MKKAVCIISGGMDSAVSAFMAKKRDHYEIVAVHYNYGQRTEQRELQAFRELCDALGVVKKIELDLHFIHQIGGSALVDESIDVPVDGVKPGVPVTYVPFRNGIFLSIAGAIAEKEEAEALYIGVVEEDSSGYPDCTDTFIKKIEAAINEGTKESTKLTIKMPLVHLKKEEIVTEGKIWDVPLDKTWSCYKNEDKACGVCDSCRLRLGGFEKAGIKDAIPYM